MKSNLWARASLLAALTTIGTAYADTERSTGDPVQGLLRADRAWSKAFGAEEKDEFFGTLRADAVLLAPHAPIAEGSESFGGLMELPGVELAWQPVAAEVSSSGDLGYTFGTYELKYDGEDGRPIVDRGKYLTVWKRQADGAWKVAVDMFNTSLQR